MKCNCEGNNYFIAQGNDQCTNNCDFLELNSLQINIHVSLMFIHSLFRYSEGYFIFTLVLPTQMSFFNKLKIKVQKVAVKSYRPFFSFGILYFIANYLYQIVMVSM